MEVLSPKKQAEELIADFLQMQPNGLEKLGIELARQYAYAKLQAQYACHVAKWSHPKYSKEFHYWQKVKDEIEAL